MTFNNLEIIADDRVIVLSFLDKDQPKRGNGLQRERD